MANGKRKRAEQPHGQYANYFKVGHNAVEFVIDLGQCYEDSPAAQLNTRIITGPIYARALRDLLAKSIEEFERQHGPITEDSQQ
jgi:hypothetical protein